MSIDRRESCDDIQIKIKEGDGEWITPKSFIVLYISQVNKIKDGFEIGVTNGIQLPKGAPPESISSYIYGLCDVINHLSVEQARKLTSCESAFADAMSIIEEQQKKDKLN